jgi:4-amino-4-deoxy-L-arabinose transferase-like glycosyltransferase
VALGLRLFRLGHQSLWIDELFTWYTAAVGQDVPVAHWLENVHGPLFSLILHLWCGFAGGSEWALRLPSAVFGAALVPVTGLVAARWLGREVAVPAAWLAAGSPFLVWYSQEARNYALLVLCAGLGALALFGQRERLTAGGLAGWLAASAAGMLSNFSYAFLAPLHLAWLAGAPGRRGRRLAAVAATAALLALVVAPWVPQVARTWDWARLRPAREAARGETALRGATTFHPAAVPFALHAFAVGYSYGPSLRELRRDASARTLARHAPALALEAAVFVPLGVLGLVAVARRRRLAELALWVAVPAIAVSYFAAQNFKVFHPRYLAVAAPAVLLVLAAGLASVRGRARVTLAAGLVAVWAWSLAQHYFDPRHAKEDYRGVAALLEARGAAGETVIAAGTENGLIHYYHGPLSVNAYWLGFAASPERMDAKLDELIAGSRAAWVVLGRSEDLDPGDVFARRLDRRWPGATRHDRPGIRVWRLPLAGRDAPAGP